jgi:MoaA/NifB/PqqE/SkfB family radical SAM enzyme
MSAAPARLLQRAAAVRLRAESWGGFAFDRAGGDLLELDREAFALLAALGTARTPTQLEGELRRPGQPVRRGELQSLLAALQRRGFVQRVAPPAPPLPAEPWAAPAPAGAGLRAPLVVHWAPTYRCNLSCPFCYAESGPHRPAGPGPEVRLRLVERLAAWGVLEVALGGGEPTLLPDFPHLLAALRAAGLVPNVTSNGTVRCPAVLRALAEHAGVVHLSADRPDLLDADRGPGVFARLRETAGALRAAGVRLGVNLLLTPANSADVRPSLQAALDLGAQAVTFLRPKGTWAAQRWPGFPGRDDLARLAEHLRAFLAERPPLRLYVDTALRREWAEVRLLEDPEPEVLGCGGGQRHVALTPEGDVYPCSHLRRPEYRLGNLLADDFDDLWSPAAEGLRRYLRDCHGPVCPCR